MDSFLVFRYRIEVNSGIDIRYPTLWVTLLVWSVGMSVDWSACWLVAPAVCPASKKMVEQAPAHAAMTASWTDAFLYYTKW